MSALNVSEERIGRLQLNIAVTSWSIAITSVAAMVLPVLNGIWEGCQLTYSQVTILQGLFALIVALGEVPAGILADLIGYRRVLIVSGLLAFAGAFVYCLACDFPTFLLAEALFAFSICLSSGCREALVYESLREQGQKDGYDRIWGRIRCIGFIVMALSCMFAGTLAEHLDARVILALVCLSFAVSAPLQWMLTEPVRSKQRFKAGEFAALCRVCLVEKRLLVWWLLFAAFLTTANQAGLWLQQPYFVHHNGLSLKAIGLVFAAGHCLAAFGSWLAPRLKSTPLLFRLLLANALVAFGYLLMGSLVSSWSFGFFYLLQLARGFNGVLFSSEINRVAHKSIRATTLSVCNMLWSATYGLLSLGTGTLAVSFGIPALYTGIGVVTLVGGSILLLIRLGIFEQEEQLEVVPAFDEAVGQ